MLVVAVVGLVGQAQPGLGQMDQIARRVLGVGVHVEADAAAHPAPLQQADDGGQRLAVGGGVDDRQFLQQRSHSALLDGLLVDEAGVQVTDSLGVGIGSATARGIDDDLANLFLGAVVELAEGPVGGTVGGHRVLGQPAAVDVAEKVVLGADRGIAVRQVDPGFLSVYRHATINTTGHTTGHGAGLAFTGCAAR